MGSGDWFRTIIKKNQTNQHRSSRIKAPTTEQSNGLKSSKRNVVPSVPSEDVAAIRIQTAIRAYKARKILHCLKGMRRLRNLTQNQSVRNQATNALGYIQTWSRIQSQISARRLCMVAEGRIKQKKLDTQSKIEAKLQDAEVEWSGGSETMEEIVARIQQRGEAAVKRERAMAYAFSHQWRANSGQNQGQFVSDFGKGNWGWSWMDRWIAARPWEARLPPQSTSPGKVLTKTASKDDKRLQRILSSVKPAAADGKRPVRKSSIPATTRRIPAMDADPKVLGSCPPENNGSSINQGLQTTEIAG